MKEHFKVFTYFFGSPCLREYFVVLGASIFQPLRNKNIFIPSAAFFCRSRIQGGTNSPPESFTTAGVLGAANEVADVPAFNVNADAAAREREEAGRRTAAPAAAPARFAGLPLNEKPRSSRADADVDTVGVGWRNLDALLVQHSGEQDTNGVLSCQLTLRHTEKAHFLSTRQIGLQLNTLRSGCCVQAPTPCRAVSQTVTVL